MRHAVDKYLEALPEESRAVLQNLREAIRAAAPDAIETISYRMPTFNQDGRFLVSYAAYRTTSAPTPPAKP